LTTASAAPASAANSQPARWLLATVVALFLVEVLLLVAGVNLRRGLNHDEHQFVASGVLLARQGLLPYRDFPYFHVPLLSVIYAALFQATDYLLLSARLFAVATSWLMLALLMAAALGWLRNLAVWMRLVTGMAMVLLLISTPSYLHASGRAWNQDLPVLLSMVAAVLVVGWLMRRRRGAGWIVGAGLLVGLAAATRLTYVLLAAPFAAAILLREPWRSRRAWGNLAWFGVGLAVGLLPLLPFFLAAPQQFIFGNLTYAGLNTAYYRQLADPDVAMTLAQKSWQAFGYIGLEPASLLLTLLALFALWRIRRQVRWSRAPEVIFLLSIFPFLLAGAFAPTPLQMQYVYPLLPFAALLLLAALARDPAPRWPVRLTVAAALVGLVLAAPRFGEGLAVVFTPDEWEPLKLHARGEMMMDLAGGRAVLTLAPLAVLEGKGEIDPALVTGPLAWRVAPLLDAAARQTYGIKSADEMAQELADRPPRALLTQVHDDDTAAEAPLAAFAAAQGYVPLTLAGGELLWLAPVARWEDRIQLGAAQLPDDPIAPGTDFLATFYLQALQPLDRDWNVLVRLVDAQGRELARSEGWPWGRPTTTWAPGEVWPDGHRLALPADAAPGPVRVAVSFYDPQTLDLLGAETTAGYLVVGDSAPDAPAGALAAFGDAIVLRGLRLPPDGWAGGATLPIAVTWETAMPLDQRYTVFMHLLDSAGQLVAQADQQPFGAFYPTDRWLPGVAVTDTHSLALPPALPPGAYTLLVGLYDPDSGARLPLSNGPGDSYRAAITVP
jgi:hypothetical protein